MDIREKLVGLLTGCGICFHCLPSGIHEEQEKRRIADYLLAHGVTVQEWIPVSEPPKEWRRDNGEMINYLVYVPEYGVDIGNYGEPAKCWLCMGLPCKPTHWAHLPQPQKGVGGDGY